ncbi:T9SS type A sorting domain-containing protein [Polluticoccus soli]|uniref:T9SS type A sorting domain-containing protein n=1 Tax=Polluticoccus soli TaxID=3034150 RepID=UPI0023E1254F|nr:T9SS type A sorting domain-containing protein [Flavipsychrobacter sp. JY13-12]
MKHTVSLAATLAAITLSFSTTFGQPSLTKIDINPSAGSSPEMLTTALNRLYFYADNGAAGKELMVYDGTGVSLVADLVPGSGGLADLSNICELNGKIYFAAPAAGAGIELFAYDGVNPPVLAKDVVPGATSSFPTNLVALNNVLYFRTRTANFHSDIYSYNPATGQLQLIATNPAEPMQGLELMVHNNKVCFSSQVNTVSAPGDGLYSFDPATNSLDTIIELDPHTGRPFGYLVDSGILYFIYSTTADGWELYKYDGVNPPVMLTNFPGLKGLRFKSRIGKLQDRILMTVHGATAVENYFAIYDNSSATVTMLDTTYAYMGSGFGLYNNRMYFGFEENQEIPLFTYDGMKHHRLSDDVSAAKTISLPDEFQVFQGDLYFAAQVAGQDRELYKFNDANLSVKRVKDISSLVLYPNPASSDATISFTLKQATKLIAQLTDMQGRVVYATKSLQYTPGQQEIKMPVQEFAPGIYIYAVMNEAGEILAQGQLIKK